MITDQKYYENVGVKAIDYFIPSFTIILAIASLLFKEIRDFAVLNLKYIFSSLDLIIVFLAVILIPLAIYYLYLFARIVKYFWTQYEFSKSWAIIETIKNYYIFFGFFLIIFAYILKQSIWAFLPLLITIVIVGLIGYFFLDFKEMKKKQKERLDEILSHQKAEKFPIVEIVKFVFIATCIMFYFGLPPINYFINDVYIFGSDYHGFRIIFFTVIVFSCFWFLLTYITEALFLSYKKHPSKWMEMIQIAVVFLFFYLVTKLVIFNFVSSLDEPSRTLVTFVTSSVGGIAQRKGKKVIDFFKRKPHKLSSD